MIYAVGHTSDVPRTYLRTYLKGRYNLPRTYQTYLFLPLREREKIYIYKYGKGCLVRLVCPPGERRRYNQRYRWTYRGMSTAQGMSGYVQRHDTQQQ